MLNVVLMGRLTANPELKTTQNGKDVCSFTVAVDERSGNGKTTSFINVVAWSGLAKFVSTYFLKGQMICISGTGRNRQWTDKNGNNRVTFEVNANTAEFCGSKESSAPVEVAPAPLSGDNAEDFKVIDDEGDLPF